MMPLFVATYLAGAALLAVWVDLRFPDVRPESWLRLGVAAALAMAFDDLAGATARVGPPIVGVMVASLLAITATFLVCIWLLRMFRRSLPT
jgi:hypothetical protein